jgi:uncharacterized membrane protein
MACLKDNVRWHGGGKRETTVARGRSIGPTRGADMGEAGNTMGQTLKAAALGAVVFMVLDGVWLGVVMKHYYREQLAPIVRLADGGIAPNWPAALVVYLLLGTGIALFVIPRAATVPLAALYGAVLGLVIYGVYDFTNFSTLRQWPFALTLVDVAWGTVATGICSAVVRFFIRS